MSVKNEDELYHYEDEFRNTIATVDEKGKRIWVFAKKPKGAYHNWRIAVTVVLLSILFSGPFLKINGQPFLLLNIFERKFVILGQAFWPQDFVLLALTLIAFFVFITLFTVVFGRIWCGWMCPQTLFMVMAYLIGVDQTLAIVKDSPSEHVAGFIGLVGFTVIFYGIYARFREQACIAVCPYGRLQGVLLIKDSIVVAYDWLRGEPRGKINKNLTVTAKTGDCIDCKLCVHVCPT